MASSIAMGGTRENKTEQLAWSRSNEQTDIQNSNRVADPLFARSTASDGSAMPRADWVPFTHCFVQLLKEYTPSSLEEAKYVDLSGKDIGRRQTSYVVILNHLKLMKHCLFVSVAIERLGICRRLQTLVLCGNCIDALRNVDCCRQLWKIDLSGNKVSASSALTRTLQSPLYAAASNNSLCCATFEWDGLRFISKMPFVCY